MKSSSKTKRSTIKKPKGWKAINPIAISHPGVDQSKLPPGQQPKLVPLTELLDEDGLRWVDYHDGEGPQLRGGVPKVTAKK